ncbi:MAG: ATP-dependent Clp protease adaptor ClpS [Acidobacteriota bacterium]
MSKHAYEPDDAVISKREEKEKLKEPPRYRVLLHNDDFTTMEFVVYVLETVFQHQTPEAVLIMYQVHTQGIALAGIYTYEIAETKVAKVIQLAREQGFPFLSTMEEE